MSKAGVTGITRTLATLLLAALGGLVFQLAGLPLPWLLGPMCATFLAALAGAPVRLPESLRPPMVTVIGTLLGASVTMEMVARAANLWLPLIGVIVFVVCGALASMVYFRLVARFDWKTAYFAGMPGGIVEMISLGAAYGADMRRIAIVHASRILLTVFLVPFLLQVTAGAASLPVAQVRPAAVGGPETWLWLAFCCVAGYFGGRLLRLPTPELLGPVLLSAALHLTGVTTFATPALMVGAAQLVIGSLIGCRFAGIRTREVLALFGFAAGSVALLAAITVAVAFGVSALSGFDPQVLILAYAPGGLTEMSLIALAMHFDVSLVIVAHIARILLVALGAAPFLALIGVRQAAGPAGNPSTKPGEHPHEQD